MIWETVQTGLMEMPCYMKSEYEGWKIIIEPSNPGQKYTISVSRNNAYLFNVYIKAGSMEEAQEKTAIEVAKKLADMRDRWAVYCEEFDKIKDVLPERVPRSQ